MSDIALTHEQERMKMARILSINPAHIQDYVDFLDGMIEKKKVLSRHAFAREVHEVLGY
jgi:hypothetical protein